MRDCVIEISNKSLNNILNFASSNDIEFECFEGSLIDNYIIYDAEGMRIGNHKPRRYAILRERYLNAWSSYTELTMTDDLEKVERFKELFEHEEGDNIYAV